MSSTINERLLLVILEEAESYGYYSSLEECTGVSAKRWRNFASGAQGATTEMLEAIAELKPNYAFWIMTGITDAANGHTAPVNAITFPERGNRGHTVDLGYFKLSLELNRKFFDEAGIDALDKKDRLEAISKANLGGHWLAGGIADVAYSIANSEEYAGIKECAIAREKTRVHDQDIIWRRKKAKYEESDSGLDSSPMLFADPRTKHQRLHDIYWEPSDTSIAKKKFAKDILNISPFKLTESDQKKLRLWMENIHEADFFQFGEYLNYHSIDVNTVIQLGKGGLRFTRDGFKKEEIERFFRLIDENKHLKDS